MVAAAGNTSLASFRRRGDVVVERHVDQGQPVWMVKDPLSRQYFRLREQEYLLWQWLDESPTLDALHARFRRQFPEDPATPEQIQQFLQSLVASGLVVSTGPWQGRRLWEAHKRRRAIERTSGLASILSLRVPLADPDRFLDGLYPWVRGLMSPTAVLLSFLLMASALSLVIAQFAEVRARLPGLDDFFTPQTAACLLVVIVLTKILHEFGHALVCKHQGCEVHEMGMMFLIFMPVLYCDVSDSWMLPSKWRRAMIGAAGMWVELVLASLAMWVWWFSHPGLVNSLALSTVMVCSVGTLFFNANPLLRFDGYYILSDLCETPNLRQRATDALHGLLARCCLGLHRADAPPATAGLLTFAIAATVYRWVLVFTILWLLEKMFEPYRLEILGRGLSVLVISGMLVLPGVRLVRFLVRAEVRQSMSILRLGLTVGVLGGLGWWALTYPTEHRVFCEGVLDVREARRVYVHTPGALSARLVPVGHRVTAGTALARLDNDTIEEELTSLRHQLSEQRAQVTQLEQDRFRDPEAAARLPAAEQAADEIAALLTKRTADAEKLVLLASEDGVLLPAPRVPGRTSDDGPLPTWSGRPTEDNNDGAWLSSGTLYGLIGRPGRVEAMLLIDQGDIEYVAEGQRVELVCHGFTETVWQGTIDEVARLDLQAVPPQLAARAGGPIPTRTDSSGRERPLHACYVARVALDDPSGGLRPGLRTTAKIHVGQQSWGTWLARQAAQTFNFDW